MKTKAEVSNESPKGFSVRTQIFLDPCQGTCILLSKEFGSFEDNFYNFQNLRLPEVLYRLLVVNLIAEL